MGAGSGDLSDFSMLDLFRIELENNSRVLEEGLVKVEDDSSPARIEPLMRAAHSVKGAARIVGLDAAVALAHAMEDVLSAAQKGKLRLSAVAVDLLLKSNDILKLLAGCVPAAIPDRLIGEAAAIAGRVQALREFMTAAPSSDTGTAPAAAIVPPPARPSPAEPGPRPAPTEAVPATPSKEDSPATPPVKSKVPARDDGEERFVRVQADNLNRLMGLSGECLVQAKSVKPFAASLLKIKSLQREMASLLETSVSELKPDGPATRLRGQLTDTQQKLDEAHRLLTTHLENFQGFSRRLEILANRLHDEVVTSRMRPFSDGLHGFPRMVRDVARTLEKKVDFRVDGSNTLVDRDILEKLEAPLNHLLRNAVDHGLETPAARVTAGKTPEGSLSLQACHRAGMLHITVADDGRGIDPEVLRAKVVEKDYVTSDFAARLTAAELMEFLFLPGFSTASQVTEVSGRGVGLDVVHAMVQEVGGSVRADSHPGKGTSFHLQLPLTLSVIRALLLEIGGEPYALPLTRVDRVLTIPAASLQTIENRQFCACDGENIGLVDARQVLSAPAGTASGDPLSVIVISDRMSRFGLAVDRFLGERSLVVRPLDCRLGKIPTISAGAILEDGSPALILDTDDLVRSIDKLLAQSQLDQMASPDQAAAAGSRRVLVVDDSLTVREVERRLLQNRGYEVTVAVDGMDGWNLLQRERFDLTITDVDMPRLNGIELVTRIKRDQKLKQMPVMIISYKDREEDRQRGLEAGADYYLTKSSFHDESLLEAVRDLIGEAEG